MNRKNQRGGIHVMRYFNAKYMTIAEVVARRLRAGEFQCGDQFYSRDELARAYHISPGTARAVLRVLEDRGIIACRKGKRPIPAAGFLAGMDAPSVCRPVFFRDSWTAETPEYDYLVFCTRNTLMRRKNGFAEYDLDFTEYSIPQEGQPGDIAVVFPSASNAAKMPDQSVFCPAHTRIDLRIDQAGTNMVSVFTRKAGLDCALHLIRHNAAMVVHVVSKHSFFPWFGRISAPGALRDFIPDCKSFTIMFDDEFEMFPTFLAEAVPLYAASGNGSIAVLIDNPYLSDYLSGEIRTGAYHPPLRYSFFGTALNERSMIFPFWDLRLDTLAATIVRTAFSKAENPSVNLVCDFHQIQFRNPGIG